MMPDEVGIKVFSVECFRENLCPQRVRGRAWGGLRTGAVGFVEFNFFECEAGLR